MRGNICEEKLLKVFPFFSLCQLISKMLLPFPVSLAPFIFLDYNNYYLKTAAVITTIINYISSRFHLQVVAKVTKDKEYQYFPIKYGPHISR